MHTEHIIGSPKTITFNGVKDDTPIDWDGTAQIRRQAYDAYLRAGFTGEQALELCKLVEFA